MPKLRVAVLEDLHAGGVADEFVVTGSQSDGPSARIYSNWSARLTEFTTACSKYNVDIVVLGGDNVDSTAADKEATWDAVMLQIYNELGDIAFASTMGNHERATAGDGAMTVKEWITAVSDSSLDVAYAAWGNTWPGAVKGFLQFCTYTYLINADFGLISMVGLLKSGATFDHWDVDVVEDYDTGKDTSVSQLHWLNSTALPAMQTRHVIVIGHYPMVTVDEGTLDLPDNVMFDTPADGEDPLQTQFSAHSQPVTAITGHYHDVQHGSPPYLINRVKVGAGQTVPYIHLRGSVLGHNLLDARGNTFYIIDIDKVLGPTNIRTFQYSTSERYRLPPHSIQAVMGHNTKRSRY